MCVHMQGLCGKCECGNNARTRVINCIITN
jgi:hypothetical protein